MSLIDTSIRKKDASQKIRGEAKYTADFVMDGVLHAITLRSTKAHASFVVKVPTLPKDVYVIDHTDVPGKNIVKIIYDDMPFFADKVVRHVGEPIALVLGEDKVLVDQVFKQIVVEYVDLPPTFEWTDSAVHLAFAKGDSRTAFEQADHTYQETFETGYQEQAYLEPQAMLGFPEEGGKVTLVGSIQCPYYVKNAVIQALDCEDEQVRVIQPAVGGAFGGKEEYPSIIACQVAVAVRKCNRPVRIVFSREEDVVSTTKRHPSKIRMEAALSKEGTILAIRAHVGLNGGAYVGLSGVVLSRAMIAVSGAYAFDHLDVSGDVYKTHTVPTGAFRGFGAPQMIFAIELFVHHIAKQEGFDPDRYRMNLLAKQGDLTSTSGTFRDPILLPELINEAAIQCGYYEKALRYAQRPLWKGIGMSLFLHGCGFTGSGEAEHIKAKVRLEKDEHDMVRIFAACVDMGQGIATTLPKIVASILEVPFEQVLFDAPDTDFVPDSGPTVASRTTMIVGGLASRAARELKDTWKDGVPQTVLKQYVQPEYMEWNQELLQGDAYPAYSWGVNIVEVDVDPDTYQVSIEHVASAYDLGKAIDERIVEGQIEGGQAQGIAYGYLEHMEERSGVLRQKNLTDYIVPTSCDTPSMSYAILDNPYPLGPYGAKGVGELTLVGGAPAVAMAIEMAIKTKVSKIPLTPESIRELMKP
jgi:CO/xanthine dehydrogenase Mo-binding subunit